MEFMEDFDCLNFDADDPMMSGGQLELLMDDTINYSKLLDDNYMTSDRPFISNPHNEYNIKSEPPGSSSSSDELNDSNDEMQTINPDEFLSDYCSSDVKSEPNLFSPNRDTPSPSTQSTDSSNIDVTDTAYRIDIQDMITTKSNKNTKDYNFETPPISPPSPDGSTSGSSTTSQSWATQNVPIINPITTNIQAIHNNPINILQGTLIPISTVPVNMTQVSSVSQASLTTLPSNLKKIKIQPRNLQTTTTLSNSIKKPGQAKTIVLSQKDYSALVQKCKSNQKARAEPITIKAVTSLATTITPKTVTPIATTTTKLQPIQIQRPTIVQTQPILMSGMVNKAAPIVAANISNIQLPVTAANIITPIVLQSRPIPSTCVTTVRTVTTTTPAPQLQPLQKVAPKPANSVRLIDDKQAKKHQRMIKNRESACLSRKKKKDYMTSLENQIDDLSKTNQKLKTEITCLRSRIAQMEKTVCQCGRVLDRSVSSFIQTATTKKKNAMFLLAMVFMVSLNFGPFGNMFSTQTDSELQRQDVTLYHSRNLLWMDEDVKKNSLNTNEEKERQNPPVFYQNDRNITTPISTNTPNSSFYPTCPLYVNQTESVRLASELRRWIGDLPHYLNISATDTAANSHFDLNSISDYLLGDDTIKSLFRHLKSIQSNEKPSDIPRPAQVTEHNKTDLPDNKTANRIQLYDPIHRDALKYAELFEELRRQDDTFYVISFSGDHLLLPALAHNKTFRPKMSLMLPSVGINVTYNPLQYVTLMQIDCEVINTSLIQIQSRLIPPHLRTKPQREPGRTKAAAQKIKSVSTANRTTTTANEFAKRSRSVNGGRAKPWQLHSSSAPTHKLNVTHNDYDYVGEFNATAHKLLFNGTSESDFEYNIAKPHLKPQLKPYFVEDERDKKRNIRPGGV